MTEADVDKLISLVFTVSHRIRERLKDTDEPHRLSAEQLESLRYIREQGRPLMKDVAAYLGITPPSATALIDILVEGEYIERCVDEDDRRAVRLTITPAGEVALEAGFKEIIARMRRVLHDLDEADRESLLAMLTKLSDIYQ